MMQVITRNFEETIEYGYKIGLLLEGGDTILLAGDLGAGKTTFTKGIGKALGINRVINSPTFTIVNEHTSDKINVYHFDVYRLEDSDEFLAIGGDEYFEKGISIIEWGEIINDVLPSDAIRIEFSRDLDNENERKLMISNLEI